MSSTVLERNSLVGRSVSKTFQRKVQIEKSAIETNFWTRTPGRGVR
jgi:hypothetical protein